MNCLSVFALLAALPAYALASETSQEAIDEQCAVDEEVSLLQAFTGLKLQQKELEMLSMGAAAAPADFEDASSFAQTQVQVESAPAALPVKAEPVFVPAQGADDEEEATCSLEGLTPGVCAMAALARAPVAGAAAGAPSADAELDFLKPDRLERALFKELEAALAGTHAGFSAEHFAELEKELSGLFAALPKNEAGLLGHAAVRYAVHQRFVRRHAWYVRSLNPVGEAQRPSSPGEELRGHVPEHLQALLEKRAEGRGLGLREMTALVATLEHLIKGDMGERLKAAYTAHGLTTNGTVDRARLGEVLRTFMAHFLSLEHRSGYAISPEEARRERNDIESDYDGWSSVDEFVEAVLKQGAPEPRFSEALAAAGEVMERFENYSVEECRGIKQRLTGMPGGAAGRVLLSDFHREAVDGKMLFAESTSYLQALGALEEGQGSASKVLVPNYITSPSNCLGTTSFFDMCCPNECEAILDSLEGALRASEATAPQIAGALARLGLLEPSAALLAELEGAAPRSGRLAVHGLALARWLHRAFPQECPRPRAADFQHHSGDSDELPEATGEFQAVVDIPVTASKAELLEELQTDSGNVSFAPVSEIAAEGLDAVKAAAAKALAEASAGSTRGLKVLTGLDATSLAQTSVDTSPAAGEEEQKRSGNTLRVKGL